MKRLFFPIFQFTSKSDQYPVILKTYCGFKLTGHIDFIQKPSDFELHIERNKQLETAKEYRN